MHTYLANKANSHFLIFLCLTGFCVLQSAPNSTNSMSEQWLGSQPLAKRPTQGWYNQQSESSNSSVIACCVKCQKGAFVGSSQRSSSHMKKTTEHVWNMQRGGGEHKPFLSVPLGTFAVLMPLVISWLAASLVTTEPFSLLFGASRAFSFLACLVPL